MYIPHALSHSYSLWPHPLLNSLALRSLSHCTFGLVCDANLYYRLTYSALIGVQFSGAVESWHLVVISLDGAPLRAPSALVLICGSAVPPTLTCRSEPVHGSLFNCMLTSFVQYLPPPAFRTSLQWTALQTPARSPRAPPTQRQDVCLTSVEAVMQDSLMIMAMKWLSLAVSAFRLCI